MSNMLINNLHFKSLSLMFIIAIMMLSASAKNAIAASPQNIDREISNSIKQLNILRNSKDVTNQFDQMLIIGDLYLKKNDYTNAKEYYIKAKSIINNKDYDRLSKSLLKLAIAQKIDGHLKDALESALFADNYSKNSGNFIQTIKIKRLLSKLFADYMDYEKSLDYALSARALINKIDDNSEKYYVYHTLATAYEFLDRFNDSEKSFFAALKYAEKDSNLLNLGRLMVGLGSLYINSGKDSLAADYLTKALNLIELKSDLTTDMLLLSDCYYNLSIAKMNLDLLAEAEKYIIKSLKISESINNKSGTVFIYEQFGLLKFNQGNLKLAIEYFEKAKQISEANNNNSCIANINKYLAMVYDQMGDKNKSIQFQKLAKDFLEKANYESKQNKTELIKNKNEAELKATELIKKYNHSETSRLVNLKLLLISLVATLCLLSFSGLWLYIKKKKKNKSENKNIFNDLEETMAQPPSNFQYNSSTHILSWSPSPDGDEYYIEYCLYGTTDWAHIYTGTNTNCNHLFPPSRYLVRGKSRKTGQPYWGVFCTPEEINVV